MSSAAVDGQQQQLQLQPLANGSPPMSAAAVQAQLQPGGCKDESPGVSPPHPQTVNCMSPTAVQDMPPESTSPVMLATMQPVSVDEYGDANDYHNQQQQQQHHHLHHHHHHQHEESHLRDDPLAQKTVIYIPDTDPQQTIIYDPRNPEASLPHGITIQQEPGTDTPSVSVLVHGQAGHHQYLGSPTSTVLVMQELVDDMGHILHRLVSPHDFTIVIL